MKSSAAAFIAALGCGCSASSGESNGRSEEVGADVPREEAGRDRASSGDAGGDGSPESDVASLVVIPGDQPLCQCECRSGYVLGRCSGSSNAAAQ